MKQTPFQQFKMPKPAGMDGRWFRRHIVIDHRHKEIQIQIMWDGSGELKAQEYFEIKKGEWWRHVPEHRTSEYRQVLASGYSVVPVVVAGGPDGQDHLCMQILELTNTHNVVKDDTMAALPDDSI